MNRENLIYKLEEVISEYKSENAILNDMRHAWDASDDLSSDPGLQYEQEQIVDEKFNNIKEILKLM